MAKPSPSTERDSTTRDTVSVHNPDWLKPPPTAEQQLAALEATAERDGYSTQRLKEGRALRVTTRRTRITHVMRGGAYEPVPERPQFVYKVRAAGPVEYVTRDEALRLLEGAA
jgi:hypothetical protein